MMSGGHFDYNSHRISDFAEELSIEIKRNDDQTKDKYGETRGYGFEEDTMRRMIKAHSIIELAGKLSHDIEWLYSDDTGEDTFCKSFDQLISKFDIL